LDFAERIPEVKAGYLHKLQNIRARQRKKATDDFKRYQIPEGTTCILVGFQLMEIFHIEDYEKLKKSFMALFPDSYRIRRRDFDRFHGDISSYGGWQHHGHLVPANTKRFIPPDEIAIIEKLSPEIDDIRLSTHQITPSLIALTMEVRLSEDTKTKIPRLFKKKYLYPTKIGWYRRKLNYLPISGRGFLHSGAAIEYRNWSEELQINVEKCVQEYFLGYFGSLVKEKIKLPRVDLFVINEPVVEGKEGEGDENSNHKLQDIWKWSLGLNVSSTYIDADDQSCWNFPDRFEKNLWPSRIIISFANFVKNKDTNSYGSEENYIWETVMDWLRTIALPFALLEYFDLERRRITRIREDVFREKNIRMKLNPRKLLALLERVESNYIVLERILMEFDLVEKFINNTLTKHTKSFVAKYDEEWSLNQAFSFQLSRNRDVLAKYNDFLQTTINQIVNVVNLRATSRLAIVSLYVALISLIVAIVALNIDWSNFIDLLW